jgi:hypothetical protein
VGIEVLNIKVRLPSFDDGNRGTTRDISSTVDSTGKLRFEGAATTGVLSCSAFMCVRKRAKSDYWLRHVRLPVSPQEITPPNWTDFHENLTFQYFSKICRENSKFIKNLARITGTLHEDMVHICR